MPSIAKIGSKQFDTMAAAAEAIATGESVTITRSGAASEVTAAFVKPGAFKILGERDAAGALPKLQLDLYTRPAFGKALFNLEDGNYEIGNLHLDGCVVPDSNGAAIRVNPGTDVVHVHHVRLTNNENGMLIADGGSSVVISDSVFDGNGRSTQETRRGYSHNIYVGIIPRIEVVRSSFLNSVFGHDFKSRADVTILSQCLFEGSKAGRALDHSNGGVLEATDCKFSKLSNSTMNNLVEIGAEAILTPRAQKYRFVNCHFHNDVDPQRGVQFIKNNSTVEVELVDPLFTGAAAAKDRKLTLTGNIKITITGGPLGPRVAVGGDPGATSTAPVPVPAPTPTPAPAPPPNPIPAPTPAPTPIPPAPQIPGVDNAAWLNLLAALISTSKSNTTLTVTIKASPTTGLTSVSATVDHPTK